MAPSSAGLAVVLVLLAGRIAGGGRPVGGRLLAACFLFPLLLGYAGASTGLSPPPSFAGRASSRTPPHVSTVRVCLVSVHSMRHPRCVYQSRHPSLSSSALCVVVVNVVVVAVAVCCTFCLVLCCFVLVSLSFFILFLSLLFFVYSLCFAVHVKFFCILFFIPVPSALVCLLFTILISLSALL